MTVQNSALRSRHHVLAVAALALGLRAQGTQNPAEFAPDGAVKGSTLTGWKVVGDADWKAQNGELIGTAKAGGAGGWLVMDKGFEDVQLFTNYRCTGACKSGVLLRAKKTPDGGMKGLFVSLTDGEFGSYYVTLDAAGKETARERIVAPARGGGAGAPERRQHGSPRRPPAPAAAGRAANAAPAAGGGGGGGGRGAAPSLKAGEWNPINMLVSATNLRVMGISGTVTLPPDSADGYGPIALYVGGTGEVRFKDLAWKDLNAIDEPKATTSARFTAEHISSFYYGWSTAGGDFNKDGNIDIAYGPFYYVGPSFTERRHLPRRPSVQPVDGVRAGHGEPRRRLHGRRLDRHPRVGDAGRPADGSVREPARREPALGQGARAADDLE